MNKDHSSQQGQCLSPGVLMALLDEELDAREKGTVLCHLRSCDPCRRLSEELARAISSAEAHLGCLDDQSIAAYVDHRTGRMRGVLSKVRMRRMSQHLAQCDNCREQVAMLMRDTKMAGSLLAGLRRFLSRPVTPAWPLRVPAARLAAVAVLAATAGAVLWFGLWSGGRHQPPGGSAVVARKPAGRVPGREEQAPQTQSPEQVAPERTPDRGSGRGPEQPGADDGGRPPLPGPETALLPPGADEETAAAIASAAAELARATARGDAGAEALAAVKLGRLYHRPGHYDTAAEYYHQAAAAAEKAQQPKLRVDALIPLGAVQAELGDTEQARDQLELALQISRQIGYVEGEKNALVQLRLLPPPQAEEGG